MRQNARPRSARCIMQWSSPLRRIVHHPYYPSFRHRPGQKKFPKSRIRLKRDTGEAAPHHIFPNTVE
ncbi:hypothetical protein VTN49DRAFT_5359 [Thermomyces lanuginosus]|uniref:uncharacterized protein n=1 Tax=Thermomyces lanuginosus TaxID=5541 RepID=UPI0037427DA0